MKYYKIGKGKGTTRFCEPNIVDTSEWKQNGLFMNKCFNRYELPIPFYVKNKYNPGDLPLSLTWLVSQRLLEVIKEVNKEYEALPSQIYYKEEPVWDVYYTMLFPEYEVFNWEKAIYKANEVKGKRLIYRMDKIVLDAEKVKQLPKENNFFCMQKNGIFLLCSEVAKQAVEQAKITGMRFVELEVL